MTRSGAAAAAPAATAANGHCAESAQAWNTLSDVLIRQPVSPMTTMRRGFGFGSASARPRIAARSTPAGIVLSQTSTGNAEGFDAAGSLRVGRSGIVVGRARMSIGSLLPSSSIAGHVDGRRDHARDRLALLAQHDERIGLRRAALGVARWRRATREQHRAEHGTQRRIVSRPNCRPHCRPPDHRQSPHAACTTAIAAAAAVSARSTRGPSRTASNPRAVASSAFAPVEPAFGTDHDRERRRSVA